MIGVNELNINQATMVTIVQEWLDKRFTDGIEPCPKVTKVSYVCNDIHYGPAGHYSCLLQSKENA